MKYYHWLKLAVLATILCATTFGSEHEIGNGGGAWVCREGNRDIRWAMPVDLFEAQNEYGLTIATYPGSYTDIVDQVQQKLAVANKKLSDVMSKYLKKIDYLKNNPPQVTYTTDDLQVIDDVLYRIKPNSKRCEGGVITYEQVVNYKQDDRILVQRDLFLNKNPSSPPNVSEIYRAALVFHEALYAYRRDVARDRNSVMTRQMIGLIFSGISTEELRNELKKLAPNSNEPSDSKPPSSDPAEAIAEFSKTFILNPVASLILEQFNVANAPIFSIATGGGIKLTDAVTLNKRYDCRQFPLISRTSEIFKPEDIGYEFAPLDDTELENKAYENSHLVKKYVPHFLPQKPESNIELVGSSIENTYFEVIRVNKYGDLIIIRFSDQFSWVRISLSFMNGNLDILTAVLQPYLQAFASPFSFEIGKDWKIDGRIVGYTICPKS